MNSDNNQLAVRKPDSQILSISTDSIQRSLEISKGLRDMDYAFNLLPEFLKNLETLLNCSPDLINSIEMEEPWKKMMTFTKENLKILLENNKKLNSFKVNYNMLMVHLQNFYKNYKENENKLSTKEIVSFFSPHFRNSIRLLEEALSEFEKANKIEPSFEKEDVTECLTELISKIGSKAAADYHHELKKVESEVEKSRNELQMKILDLIESEKKEFQEIAKAESEVERNEKKKLRLQEQNQRNIGKIERLRKEIDENKNNGNNTIDELHLSIMTRIQNLEKEKSDLLKQKNSETDRINDDFKKFMHSTEEDLNNLEKKNRG